MFTPFRLNKTIGEAYDMDLADSLNTKKALQALGHLKAPNDGFTSYPDQAMIDGLKSFQRDQGLRADGIMKPDGPTFKRLSQSFVARQDPPPYPTDGFILMPPDPQRDNRRDRPGPFAPIARTLELRPEERNAPPEISDLLYRPDWARPGAVQPRLAGMAASQQDNPQPSRPAKSGNPQVAQLAGDRSDIGISAFGLAASILGMKKLKEDLEKNKGSQDGNNSERIAPKPDIPPLPGYPAPTGNERMPSKTEYPADPPKIPALEGVPVGKEAKAQLLIFEELHDDLKQSLAKPLENRRGDAFTQRGNELVAGPCLDALKREYEGELQKRVKHVGGGIRASDGKKVKEAYLPEKKTKGKKGSSYADVTLENQLTGDKLHVNTANTLADGKTPVADERRKLYKMRNNADIHDVVTVLPKLRPGMDEQDYVNRCIDLLRAPYYQWMGRPKSK